MTMLAEATIARLWPLRHDGRHVRAVLQQSIRDAQSWKRMGTRVSVSSEVGKPPPRVPVEAVREPDREPDEPQTTLW